jgi:ribosomal protein L37AE/L43A
MPYKFCPNCFSTSYSSAEHKIWLCPSCGKDISFMPSCEEAYDLRDTAKVYDRPKPYRLEKTKL